MTQATHIGTTIESVTASVYLIEDMRPRLAGAGHTAVRVHQSVEQPVPEA